MNQQEMDAGVPIVAGTGIVLRYHPLTLVIEPASNPESVATAASELIGGLLSDQSFDFASVADALQGLVVAEQPLGVAAVVDVENPIIFLFDQAAAEGGSERHQSQGRSGWTTAYASSEQITLMAGNAVQNPAVQHWSRLAKGIVSGSGAQVRLGIEPPEPLGAERNGSELSDEGRAQDADRVDEAEPATVAAGSIMPQPANTESDTDTDTDTTVETDGEIEVLETEFAAEDVAVDDTPRAPVGRDELRRTIAAASLAAGASTVDTTEAIVEENPALDDPGNDAFDPDVDAFDPDVMVTEVLDPAELGLAVPDEAVIDVTTPDGGEIDLVGAEPEPQPGPSVIAGPPPMPTPASTTEAKEPRVIAGPPPMPDADIDITDTDDSAGPETIIMPDPMKAAGPEPADDDSPAPKVIAGPPPMPDSNATRVRS